MMIRNVTKILIVNLLRRVGTLSQKVSLSKFFAFLLNRVYSRMKEFAVFGRFADFIFVE